MIKLNMMYSCESSVYIWLNNYTFIRRSSKKTLCSQKPDFQSSTLTFFPGVLFLKTEYWLSKHIIGLKLIVCLPLQRPKTSSIHSHHVKLQSKCVVSFLNEIIVLLSWGWVQEPHGSLGKRGCSTTKPHVNLWICISVLVVETKVTLGAWLSCLSLSGLSDTRQRGCFDSTLEDKLTWTQITLTHIWLHIIYNAVSSQRAGYTYCWFEV